SFRSCSLSLPLLGMLSGSHEWLRAGGHSSPLPALGLYRSPTAVIHPALSLQQHRRACRPRMTSRGGLFLHGWPGEVDSSPLVVLPACAAAVLPGPVLFRPRCALGQLNHG